MSHPYPEEDINHLQYSRFSHVTEERIDSNFTHDLDVGDSQQILVFLTNVHTHYLIVNGFGFDR
ncbi:hypothetical protein RO3G_06491 [Rhizopus delemar RA 99-880]|uniref:Uncharacterized protein n=1 Tax=Rhizopus delemar (strain RA 99-880 / ATCC MYA-4621 / FGSC 9543 / NRRL 43880) TaxID=246409 RepID=I1C006_RHIO9|nr:hypothetical protein RO3G_06491 [Rhizopus delemar RA 99-880]|eukprot:EIE81786.1 hypothetical protein RO3G_06491 [Rhizopus delemar RA 99-880]